MQVSVDAGMAETVEGHQMAYVQSTGLVQINTGASFAVPTKGLLLDCYDYHAVPKS